MQNCFPTRSQSKNSSAQTTDVQDVPAVYALTILYSLSKTGYVAQHSVSVRKFYLRNSTRGFFGNLSATESSGNISDQK